MKHLKYLYLVLEGVQLDDSKHTPGLGLKAVPEIILGGWAACFFSDPSTPRTHVESEPPRPLGHVSALINPPHYGSNMP